MWNSNENMAVLNAYSADGVGSPQRGAGYSAMVIANSTSARVSFSSEL